MKIIFLDIDGVLNNHKYLTINRFIKDEECNDIDESKVLLLKSIVKKTNAKLVLSSSWKRMFDEQLSPRTESAAKIINILSKNGLFLLDKTADLNKKKGDEIRKWLAEHQDSVDRFVILDDDLNSNWGELTPYLIKTSYYIGLTEVLVNCAVQKLNN